MFIKNNKTIIYLRIYSIPRTILYNKAQLTLTSVQWPFANYIPGRQLRAVTTDTFV